MPSPTPTRRQRVTQYVALAAVCVLAAVQFLGTDPRPWEIAAAWAAATALLFGPVAWVARDRIPEERRKTLAYVVASGAILIAIVWLGAALAFAPRLYPFGPGSLAGVAFGTLVVLLAERTVVPERLRGAGI
ncbi:hypothetical protein [Halorubrum sp. LN27]|uniref:hypothetical protein n=1 Tax=Halorubrum sp. LN27 TaxID=2801032 RepID=UPI00190DD99A|nr:hypothetical protein [Halorubrum sp. LN27]